MFPKIEDLNSVLNCKPAGKVNDHVFADGFQHGFDRIPEGRVPLELGVKYLYGCKCVCFGAVSFLVYFVTVKLIGGAEGALLHQVKDLLNIQELAATHVK